jgi:hypothetical protein
LALDTINLKPAARLAHTDYSLEYHKNLVRKKTGLDPSHPDAGRKFYDACGIDFLFGTNDGLHGDWGKFGRATDMGHAVYAADGSDMHTGATSPFAEPEDVWAFDAVSEYGLPDFDGQVAAYEAIIQNARDKYPDQLSTGGYYKSIISGAIAAFGWEMLLLGASDQAKMEKVLDSFFRFTLFHMRAWAQTSAEVIIQHDDFVWTGGPFMYPDYYRKVIIARYAQLWKPLREAGKKVLFCSDGNFMELAGDLADAGADGFIFEPMNDFGYMAGSFGQTKALVGSYVDCRDMTFGKWEQVKADIDRTLEASKKCKGLIFAVGNHLPANIPEAMIENYLSYLMKNWFISR